MDVSEVLNIHEQVSRTNYHQNLGIDPLQSLTATATTSPVEEDSPTVYTGLIAQARFHLQTNSLHHRLISRPDPSLQEILDFETTIDECGNCLPSYFQQDSTLIASHTAFLFSRYRLSWRIWNMKIMLLRPVLLRWSVKHKSGDSKTAEAQDEVYCRENCLQHARSTITSISEYMSLNIDSRLSTWYIL